MPTPPSNGVAGRALQRAGLHVQSEPLVMRDPVPVTDDAMPVIRDPATEVPAAIEQPVAIPSAQPSLRLLDLLYSMTLVAFGITLGLGVATLVVWLGGRG